MTVRRLQPAWRFSRNEHSGEPGAVQETELGIFGRIPKNDWGRGGAWDFYWAALFPRGGKRIRDAQLFVVLMHDRIEYGFSFGEYSGEQVQRFFRNVRAHRSGVGDALTRVLDGEDLWFGRRESTEAQRTGRTERVHVAQWLDALEAVEPQVRVIRLREEVLAQSQEALTESIVEVFRRLFPLMLLTILDDPLPAILEYVAEPGAELPAEVPTRPPYSLTDCAEDTGLDEARLGQWVQAVDRKGQAILYGPPGTGKTFVAEHLARHLVAGGTGFVEVLQFHPAYAYEDFIQGIRPRVTPSGQLTYEPVRGRFVDFCDRARRCPDRCVLIVDEINRANLARVFGELMYLLEYRKHEISLAGGERFQLPENVRLLGTMNTADRSIALVDHALRRRFAFFRLQPDYTLLRRFHERRATGVVIDGLIDVLQGVNREINDPNYEVGVTFFLDEDLEDHLEDIWRMEIEPYLEEYFFDRRPKVEALRWERVRERLATRP